MYFPNGFCDLTLLHIILILCTLGLRQYSERIICMDLFPLQAPKRTAAKKESKERRESNEESKENLKAKSDDSGEEKNGDDDSQKNGPKKKGDDMQHLVDH